MPWRADVHDELLTGLLGRGHRARASRDASRPAGRARGPGLGSLRWPPGQSGTHRRSCSRRSRRMASGCPLPGTPCCSGIDHPAVKPLLEYKELARLHAAHGWAWLDTWVSGGRFKPEYVVGGVVSGRWASRGGGALQISRVLRRAVLADSGWVLVVADAAQLEPRGCSRPLPGIARSRRRRRAVTCTRRWPASSAETAAKPRSPCCRRCTAAPGARRGSCWLC